MTSRRTGPTHLDLFLHFGHALALCEVASEILTVAPSGREHRHGMRVAANAIPRPASQNEYVAVLHLMRPAHDKFKSFTHSSATLRQHATESRSPGF